MLPPLQHGEDAVVVEAVVVLRPRKLVADGGRAQEEPLAGQERGVEEGGRVAFEGPVYEGKLQYDEVKGLEPRDVVLEVPVAVVGSPEVPGALGLHPEPAVAREAVGAFRRALGNGLYVLRLDSRLGGGLGPNLEPRESYQEAEELLAAPGVADEEHAGAARLARVRDQLLAQSIRVKLHPRGRARRCELPFCVLRHEARAHVHGVPPAAGVVAAVEDAAVGGHHRDIGPVRPGIQAARLRVVHPPTPRPERCATPGAKGGEDNG
mmetsp:Transcript_78329/g.242868  ORF Transcript_78329/g.242868 Transcript_78329/m.242868 type:complete len:265 (-) Transcript_78329:93-887(-)